MNNKNNKTMFEIKDGILRIYDVKTNDLVMEVSGLTKEEIHALLSKTDHTDDTYELIKTKIEGLNEYFIAKAKLTSHGSDNNIHNYLRPVTHDLKKYIIELLRGAEKRLNPNQLVELYKLANNIDIKAEVKRILIATL